MTEWATELALELSGQIGCRYIVLEAKDSKVKFYNNIGFEKGASLTGDRLVWHTRKSPSKTSKRIAVALTPLSYSSCTEMRRNIIREVS